jgi:hypothetical protein
MGGRCRSYKARKKGLIPSVPAGYAFCGPTLRKSSECRTFHDRNEQICRIVGRGSRVEGRGSRVEGRGSRVEGRRGLLTSDVFDLKCARANNLRDLSSLPRMGY